MDLLDVTKIVTRRIDRTQRFPYVVSVERGEGRPAVELGFADEADAMSAALLCQAAALVGARFEARAAGEAIREMREAIGGLPCPT